jgi:lipoprotein-anchoring transpeptidase ErfK/SrfK
MMHRRLFLAGMVGVAFPGRGMANEPFRISPYDEGKVEYKFRRREVDFKTTEPPGTIVVDLRKRFLFLVLPKNRAIRFGIGVGSQYTRWSGTATISRKTRWPTWTPTPDMLARHKHYAKWKDGMPGGPDNPLGARALYLLNEGGVDNHFRIHGSPWPETIGKATTSGCFRMLNVDVVDLYNRVEVGTRVVVLAVKRGV